MAKKKFTTEQQSEESARVEIQAVLETYNCELRARVTIEGSSTETQIVIRSKPKTQ